MTGRRLLLAAGAVVVLVAAGAVSVGAETGGTDATPEKINLITRATPINNFVDVGPTGPSPGDIYVFVDDVFFASAPSDKVGEALGRCTVIDPAKASLGCSITTSLSPNDAITSEGTLINAPGAKSTGAITGGTGRFRNARGEGVLDLGPPEGPHTVTFTVITRP